MSSRFKILTGLKVKKRSWIPKIKRRKGNNEKNEPTLNIISSTEQTEQIEQEEISHKENQVQLYSIKAPVSIINLPTEIYLQIFSYLLFTDLYTLSSVSKFFRDLLWSKSEFTQSIWKNCRLVHYPEYPKLPPPDGMCEQQYIWITLATKTCQFCNEPYEKTSFDKWLVKINCCDHCMSTDEYIIEEISVKRSLAFPYHLKGCIPHTEYLGYLNDNIGNRNCHKYYFIQNVEKIENEYNSLPEGQRKGWIENKSKELKIYSDKIKDYQVQDRNHYWSQFAVSKPEKDDDIIIDVEVDVDEEEADIDQNYDQDFNINLNYNSLLNQGYLQSYNPGYTIGNFNGFNHVYNSNYFDYDNNLDDYDDEEDEILS
ncbi:hypothetical protein C1645_781276 [Glomus cerebriforme]|uniref:F-box domain-containing protein n=1 Tax=Glomus cerebriforme TaxID=658196 RepID=A0A397SI72_9GLOM|nr:hypothetical protein C1645_781276 [Glomus cerebriforme]